MPNTHPNNNGFQYLEDLSCAYWQSQVFFTALELKLFMHIHQKKHSIEMLSEACSCDTKALMRLLKALETMDLLNHKNNKWENTKAAATFLIPEKPDYMGDFFLYRKYMRPNWDLLTQKISRTDLSEQKDLSYEQKNFLYVKAMDTIIRQKARQIAAIIAPLNLSGSILDVGGGAAGMIRQLLTVMPDSHGQVLEIAEVIQAAEQLYPDKKDWDNITKIPGDFRSHEFDASFSLIIMSNFLHTYSPVEAQKLLLKAVKLLKKTGVLLIHDYFPDRKGVNPAKGSLYDLSMMLNTYNGACHDARLLSQWLQQTGLQTIDTIDLDSDTSIILAHSDPDA